ncbi:hypothetical protein BKM63_20480 [Flavobacterium johnsoniae]|uniref:Uncharacterized protein n=1 Tax=Flavobacterium johnsoniae TaxID=986 RepID=A0A1J7BP05_FLAJO|nr:hypothetical protein BKM63_20480 [Flavobacterium johnsoniae]
MQIKILKIVFIVVIWLVSFLAGKHKVYFPSLQIQPAEIPHLWGWHTSWLFHIELLYLASTLILAESCFAKVVT